MEINKTTSEYYLDAIMGSSSDGARALQVETQTDEDILNPKDKTSISPEAKEAASQMRTKSLAEQAGGNGQHGAPSEEESSAGEDGDESLSSTGMGGGGANQSSSSDKVAELKAKLEQLGSRLSQILNSGHPDEAKEAQAAPISAQMSEISAQIAELEAEAEQAA